MAYIEGRDLEVFKDAAGVHDFTAEELKHIHKIAQELKTILDASKKREQDRTTKQDR